MIERIAFRSQWLAFLGLTALISGCGAPSGKANPPAVDQEPFANLLQCSEAPYVGVFRGFTQEGLANERNGSAPSWDVYGLRPDGSAERITTDLGSYDFGISADGLTIFVSPSPEQTGPRPEDTSTPDQIVAIDIRTGEESVLLEVPGLLAVVPSPDGSQLAVTSLTGADPSLGTGDSRLAIFDLNDRGGLKPVPGFEEGSNQVDRNPVWSPDGLSLAYIASLSNSSNEIRVVDMGSAEERVAYTDDAKEGSLLSLDWSLDGRFLLMLDSGIRRDSGERFDNVIEIDIESKGSTVVLYAAVGGDLSYSSSDGSRITSVFTLELGAPVLAQSWTRGEDGTYLMTSSAEVGKDVGLVGADRLAIPDCAIA